MCSCCGSNAIMVMDVSVRTKRGSVSKANVKTAAVACENFARLSAGRC